MGKPRFYSPVLEPGVVRLSDSEARHSYRARRLSVGDEIMLFDGCGHEAAGQIVVAGKQTVEVSVENVVSVVRPNPNLTLAFGIPKGPRQDMLIEKCTELGVAVLQPFISERSVAEATPNRLQKWHRTAVEAAKQSGQCWLPEFREPKPLLECIAEFKSFDRVWLAMPGGKRLPSIGSLQTILGIVGPEGGWTQDEIEQMQSGGAKPISLGSNILRIETAAIALAAIVHAAAG